MATGNQPTDAGGTAQVVTTQPVYRVGSAPPLDPIQQVAAYAPLNPTSYTVPAGGTIQVIDPDINRVAFMVDSVALRDFRLTPSSDATAGPMAGMGTSRTPQVIHSSVYPLLCQGAWFVVADAGVVVRVLEILKAG